MRSGNGSSNDVTLAGASAHGAVAGRDRLLPTRHFVQRGATAGLIPSDPLNCGALSTTNACPMPELSV